MKRELKQKALYTLEDCFSLKGKDIVIIGGAGKMAESFSKVLLASGSESLTIADINTERMKKVVKQLHEEFGGRKIYSCKCNVSDEGEVDKLFNFLRKNIKKVDVLIYSVMSKPVGYYAPFSEYKPSTWDKVLKENLSGAFLIMQRLLSLMNVSASIILMSSIYGITAPDLRIYEKVKSNIYGGRHSLSLPAVYTVSKTGLIGLSKYMAVYLAERDIRINALVAGGVYDNQEENFYKEYIKRVPLKRMATWTDFNGAILFLASDASRYMTGQTLVIDGGWSTW